MDRAPVVRVGIPMLTLDDLVSAEVGPCPWSANMSQNLSVSSAEAVQIVFPFGDLPICSTRAL